MKELLLKYNKPASDSDEGWERQSLPLGCGYFGVNVFGIVESERLQITENSFETRYNLTDAAEFRLNFPHTYEAASNYERGLSIDYATAYVKYDFDGVHYEREMFTSYPDHVMGIRLTASEKGKLEFSAELQVPFIVPFGSDDGMGRSGSVYSEGNMICSASDLEYYNVHLSSQVRILTDGKIISDGTKLFVEDASTAVLYFSCGTNYKLCDRVYSETDPKKKLDDFDPAPYVSKWVEAAASKGLDGYNTVKRTHIEDYRGLFSRVELDLGGSDETNSDQMTNDLLANYKFNVKSAYLETLYYQYGRYMLICSSREGCLPPNLQGIWNCHKKSPWGSGYWHNINIQMNYWPVFSTNLAELFKPYSDLNHAFRSVATKEAVRYAKQLDLYDESIDDYGWCVGTAVYPYEPGGIPGAHSGPGTGGLTTKLFWDWWDFTRDRGILEKYVYPTIHQMSKFLVRAVADYDGEYLSKFSASPEQMVQVRELTPKDGNKWSSDAWTYYHTVGCAFDQQMIQENGYDDLKCASVLGVSDKTTAELEKQTGHYHPVEIGLDGQIKEYREEKFYGEIGEANHRHISQLVGLMPGTIITRDTPAWLDAAKRTLNFRTDESTGWALAHRLNAWARTYDGNRAYRLFRNLIALRTFDNLWDAHPPFQIDGNFGGTSGVTEMLLQSHTGYIEILPSLPDVWNSGSYKGLVARGNFEVSVKWENKRANKIEIVSRSGEVLKLRYPLIGKARIKAGEAEIHNSSSDKDVVEIETVKGMTYTFDMIPEITVTAAPKNARVLGTIPHIIWDASPDACVRYNIYRNTNSAPDYEIVAKDISAEEFVDFSYKPTPGGYAMYKITANRTDTDAVESEGTLCVKVDKTN
ncbi:MAG: glycoside hydrolase N-terminal domain-containing protein [Firmicutes bacterium]|nr:glycoside hydrolase N-terminal domain-containing protein [Bacillota bacterium]